VLADAFPACARPFHAVNAAVALLIQNVRRVRMESHAVGILSVLRIGIGQEVGAAAGVERLPVTALVEALEDTAATSGDGEVEMARVARVDQNRVQFRAVRCAGLGIVARPQRIHRVLVESGYWLPGVAGVFRAEEAFRRRAGVPRMRLTRVTG